MPLAARAYSGRVAINVTLLADSPASAVAGRDTLPVTFVAHGQADEVAGAVGLDTYDLDERRDVSPWVTGMIVRPDRRGQGVGRTLLQHLEQWALLQGIAEAWVGTDTAAGFYQRCGWTAQETFVNNFGVPTFVLYKRFP